MPKQNEIKTVPNQKVVSVCKLPCDKKDKSKKYTVNRLEGIDQAAKELKSKAGFKLYIYLAKNQHDFKIALSSADFCSWSSCALTAYNTAVEELIEKGFLKQESGNNYIFYDYSEK
jgi:hypothetical protein